MPLWVVTGANGFLASHIIAQLLADFPEVTIRGTVRDPENAAKVAHLKSLPGASERLSLVKADVLNSTVAEIQEAVAGAEVVLHTATPYYIVHKAKDLGEEFFVSHAREGALNVLNACAAAGCVKAVVLTSSTAAVLARIRPAGHVYTEADWNDPEELRTRAVPLVYAIGKTLQERAAWEWLEARTAASGPGGTAPFRLVALNPCLIGGPMLQAELNASSETLLEFLNGKYARIPPALTQPWVDVRDVALAHIRAAQREAASGRYLLISEWAHAGDICKALHEMEPSAPVPTEMDEGAVTEAGKFDATKSQRDLGLEFRPLKEILAASLASLKEKGFLKV